MLVVLTLYCLPALFILPVVFFPIPFFITIDSKVPTSSVFLDLDALRLLLLLLLRRLLRLLDFAKAGVFFAGILYLQLLFFGSEPWDTQLKTGNDLRRSTSSQTRIRWKHFPIK